MKNALITGGTKGMGRAIAIAFAKENVNIAVCARNAADLDVFKKDLNEINPDIKVVTVVADGSNREELLNFAQTAQQELGNINIIVNNLGMYAPTSILNDENNLFQKVVNTNLMPAYELYRFFGKSMVSVGEGHIFNICSIAALDPIPEAGIYSVTKAALLCLNDVMRLEMEQYGVKITAVIPGSTLTDSWKGIAVDKDKMVLPEDIASAIINIYKMSAGANVDQIIIKPVYGQV